MRGFARKSSDKTSKLFSVISITSCKYAFYENGTKYACLFVIKTEVMNFRTGQKVICVNDQFKRYCAYPIKKGVIYTIDGFYKCPCGSEQVTLREKNAFIDMICKCDRLSYRRQSFYSWRFIPLEMLENFISLSDKKKDPERIPEQTPGLQEREIINIPYKIWEGKINFLLYNLK
jgi:hypothetical protein